MRPLDLARTTQDEGSLDEVLELPHVARVVVRHQAGKGFVTDPRDPLALERVEPVNEVLDQEGYIFQTIAQWRDRLETMRSQNRRAVVWGSGSKGVTFTMIPHRA